MFADRDDSTANPISYLSITSRASPSTNSCAEEGSIAAGELVSAYSAASGGLNRCCRIANRMTTPIAVASGTAMRRPTKPNR
jgi:hypothetical protein